MKLKLKETRGDFTLNGAFLILLIAAGIIAAITVIGVASQGIRLHTMASELTRYIEQRGRVDSAVYTELERLAATTGIDADIEITADYIYGTSKIQFGNAFTVELSYRGSIGLGGIVSVPVPLRSVVSGRSEQYWSS